MMKITTPTITLSGVNIYLAMNKTGSVAVNDRRLLENKGRQLMNLDDHRSTPSQIQRMQEELSKSQAVFYEKR